MWREKQSSGFPTRSDINQPVQSQKIDGSLKFWLYVEEELYYPCSENKGADQLRNYCQAYLRLCFRMCKKSMDFAPILNPWRGSYISRDTKKPVFDVSNQLSQEQEYHIYKI